MRFRTAQAADAEAITGLINLAFRVERFFIESDRIELDQVRGLFESGEFLVVEDGGVLVACAYIQPRGERGYVGLLSVDPQKQGAGLGTRIMRAAEDRCGELGCRFVDIQIVNLRKELPRFYQRLAYVETGTAPFPSDIETKFPCHFVTMSKALR